jgi:hypothetical protein
MLGSIGDKEMEMQKIGRGQRSTEVQASTGGQNPNAQERYYLVTYLLSCGIV